LCETLGATEEKKAWMVVLYAQYSLQPSEMFQDRWAGKCLAKPSFNSYLVNLFISFSSTKGCSLSN